MRKLIVALLVTSFALPFVNGQGPSARGRRVPVPGSPNPGETAPEPSPRKPSLFKRLFGPLPTPTPIPRVTPTPKPAPIVKRRPRPKARPVATAKPAVAANTTASATASPAVKAPAKPSTKTKATPPTSVASGLDDPAKFQTAKAAASEDPAIKDLKNKADGEVNEAEAGKALAAYNRALFRKIREIDPSVSEYADKVEQSMTKRIGAEKGTE